MYDDELPNLLTSILEKKNVEGLISIYEMMLDTKKINNTKYILKIQEYLDKIHIPIISICNEEILKAYNNNEYFTNMLKRKMINLLALSKESYFDEKAEGGVDEPRKGKYKK